jgi:hypothetical protein
MTPVPQISQKRRVAKLSFSPSSVLVAGSVEPDAPTHAAPEQGGGGDGARPGPVRMLPATVTVEDAALIGDAAATATPTARSEAMRTLAAVPPATA